MGVCAPKPLLAMVVNDNARVLDKRGVFESIASKLAPAGFDHLKSAYGTSGCTGNGKLPCQVSKV